MVCVICGSETQVTNSRLQKRANHVWRRRKCTECGAIFTTIETTAYEAVWLVQGRNGELLPFSRDKLFLSLYESCRHRQTALTDARALTDTVTAKLNHLATAKGSVEAENIITLVQVALNRFDKAASSHYRAFHS